jgi:hypothetical protein
MRHITGFFLALATSAALFFGAGWGVWRFTAIQSSQGVPGIAAWTNTHNVFPLAALLGTGLMIGIFFAVRGVSALATGLPGLAVLGWSALVVLRGKQALNYVPISGSHYAAGFAAILSSGALALLGAGMIIPLFMPSRWRSNMTEVEEFEDDEFATTSSLGLVP